MTSINPIYPQLADIASITGMVSHQNTSNFKTKLEKLTHNLLWMSETDAPIQYIQYPRHRIQHLSTKNFTKIEPSATGQNIKEVNLKDVFKSQTYTYQGMTPDEISRVKNMKKLQSLVQRSLTDVKVFRVGGVNAYLYIIGRNSSGNFEGFKSNIVET